MSYAKRRKAPEDENAALKKLLAELSGLKSRPHACVRPSVTSPDHGLLCSIFSVVQAALVIF